MEVDFKSLVVLLLALALGNSCGAVSLLDAYEDALQYDRTYQANKARQEAAWQSLPQARSRLLPSLSANGSYTDTDLSQSSQDQISTGLTDSEFDTRSYGFQLRQVLFDGQVFTRYQQAKFIAELAELELASIDQELIVRVARAYFNVLEAADDATLAKANLKSSQEQFDQVKSRFEVGLAPNAEYQQALSRWQLAITTQLQSDDAFAFAQRSLRLLTGKDYVELNTLDDNVDIESLYQTPKGDWLNEVLQGNLQYLKSEVDYKIAAKEVQVQRSGHLPSVELLVGRNSNLTSPGSALSGLDTRQRTTDVMVQFSMPIFTGGLIRSQVAAAKSIREASRNEFENTRLTTINAAELLLDNARRLKKTVAAFERAVEAGKQALISREQGFKAGLDTNLNVLDAQRDLFQVSLDANSARYDSIVLGLQLEQLRGSLDRTDLEKINELLTDKSKGA